MARRSAFVWCSSVVVVLANAAVSHADLIHRYSFTVDASDSVGTAHGTIVGGASIVGGAVQLDGIDDYIDLPGNAIGKDSLGGVNNLTNATFEGWWTHGRQDSWQRLFDFGDTNGASQGRNYLFMSPTSGGNDHRGVISDADPGFNSEEIAAGAGKLPDGSYHMALVYDDAGSMMHLYVDGALAGSTAVTKPLSAVSDVHAYLGRALYNDPLLLGSIDEFRIYDEALNSDQVLASFQAGPDASFVAVPEPSAIALWMLIGMIGAGLGIHRCRQ